MRFEELPELAMTMPHPAKYPLTAEHPEERAKDFIDVVLRVIRAQRRWHVDVAPAGQLGESFAFYNLNVLRRIVTAIDPHQATTKANLVRAVRSHARLLMKMVVMCKKKKVWGLPENRMPMFAPPVLRLRLT